MSKNMWPSNTASPTPGGTHWVLRRDPSSPATKWFLLTPKSPDQLPNWTSEQSKAGVWSLRDAEQLAALHRRLPNTLGLSTEAWAEWIGPPEAAE